MSTVALTQAAQAAAAPTRQRLWLVSARYDVGWFFASALAPLAFFGAWRAGAPPVAIFVVFQLFFNLPHNLHTWSLSVLDREDRRAHRTRYLLAFLVPLALFGGAKLVSPRIGYEVLGNVLNYWGYYHLVRQGFGFLRIYEARGGRGLIDLRWLLYALCWVPPLWRMTQPHEVWGKTVVGGVEVRLWLAPIPAWVGPYLIALFAALLLVWIGLELRNAARGQANPGRVLAIATPVALYAFCGFFVTDWLVFAAMTILHHNIQYMALMWRHDRGRAAAEPQPSSGNPLLSAARAGSFLRYWGLGFLYGAVLVTLLAVPLTTPLGEVLVSTVVAGHYVVDSYVWRFTEYPMRGVWLGLRAPRPAPATATG